MDEMFGVDGGVVTPGRHAETSGNFLMLESICIFIDKLTCFHLLFEISSTLCAS